MPLVLSLTHVELFESYIHTWDNLDSEIPLVDTRRSLDTTLRAEGNFLCPCVVGSNFYWQQVQVVSGLY